MTSFTPLSPRRTRLFRKVDQNGSASEGPMCKPTISRRPSLSTATATIAATLTGPHRMLSDHRLGARLPRLSLDEFGLRGRKLRLARQHKALQGGDVVGQGRSGRDHTR